MVEIHKVICDLCGEQIEGASVFGFDNEKVNLPVAGSYSDPPSQAGKFKAKYQELDLHPACAKNLVDAISEAVAKTTRRSRFPGGSHENH